MYEGNEWPEYPVFGPFDPSPKAFTDPQKTGSKTSESTPTCQHLNRSQTRRIIYQNKANFLLHSYVAV